MPAAATIPTRPGSTADTVYTATGIGNAYDLVFHSNGQLYVPANRPAAGGNTPAIVRHDV